MENNGIDHTKIERLRIAANFDANNTYPMLFQLLGYRKLLAEQLLQNKDINLLKELEYSFDHVNNQIKKLLGLKEI